MINANTRSLLTDALTPPAGYQFDTGIATTYSLDLNTLLAIPLHLAWLATSESERQLADPIRLLEALRRTAGRLTIFAERSRIQAPQQPHALIGLLEDMIFEARAPHGGAFHPKVWILRFTAGEKMPPVLRLLVLSRNITADASWDLSLVLEGSPGRKQLVVNKPLGKFLSALPAYCTKEVPAPRRVLIEELIGECLYCDWNLPGNFESLKFHPLGIGRKPTPWDLPESHELGVISPFVSPRALAELRRKTDSALFLISRPEELDGCPDVVTAPGFDNVMVLDEQAETGDQEEDRTDQLRGLHAKALVMRRAWDTHLFVGSANATNAALIHGMNVEFMVELIGKHSKVGRPEAWLSDDGIRDILTPYQPSIPDASVIAAREAEERLEACRQLLSRADLRVRCEPCDGDWRLFLQSPALTLPEDISASAWLLTVSQDRAMAITPAVGETSLGVYAAQEVTSLTGLHIRLGEHALSFGLDLPLVNPPTNREAALMRQILRNRDGFVRYLMLLLGDWDGMRPLPRDAGTAAAPAFSGAAEPTPLFESLTRAFARDPDRMQEISTVIARLQQTGKDGEETLVPEDFLDIWRVFDDAIGSGVCK
ncbi:phospholipase D family protein [Cupriavidus necator]|uniref:phospholipase D family protein n=1 Tax=Cupriavidus necator TaxID=106590 RepID=UPI003ED10C42